MLAPPSCRPATVNGCGENTQQQCRKSTPGAGRHKRTGDRDGATGDGGKSGNGRKRGERGEG